jgi:hypothetical protein
MDPLPRLDVAVEGGTGGSPPGGLRESASTPRIVRAKMPTRLKPGFDLLVLCA